jgi:TadE-like protein
MRRAQCMGAPANSSTVAIEPKFICPPAHIFLVGKQPLDVRARSDGGLNMSAALSRRRHLMARKAAAAAEMAICLPLMVMLVLGSIETCSMIYLRHSLTIASYEGARVAIDFDGTSAAAVARCQEILDAREVVDADINIEPDEVANVDRGQQVAITVSAPCDSNNIIPAWFYGGKTLSHTMTMVKE